LTRIRHIDVDPLLTPHEAAIVHRVVTSHHPFASSTRIEETLLRAIPRIAGFETAYIFPDSVRVRVRLRKTALQYKDETGRYLLFDSSGVMYEMRDEPHVSAAHLKYYQRIFPSSMQGKSFSDVRFAADAVSQLEQYGHLVSTVDIVEPRMIRCTIGNTVALLTVEKDVSQQVTRVHEILRRSRQREGVDPREIDVRFEKIIIR
jgi:hypothetical protein